MYLHFFRYENPSNPRWPPFNCENMAFYVKIAVRYAFSPYVCRIHEFLAKSMIDRSLIFGTDLAYSIVNETYKRQSPIIDRWFLAVTLVKPGLARIWPFGPCPAGAAQALAKTMIGRSLIFCTHLLDSIRTSDYKGQLPTIDIWVLPTTLVAVLFLWDVVLSGPHPGSDPMSVGYTSS